MAEWLKAPDSKSGRWLISCLEGSNPSLSASWKKRLLAHPLLGLAKKRKRKGKLPKNKKKCRLELYFGQNRAFLFLDCFVFVCYHIFVWNYSKTI